MYKRKFIYQNPKIYSEKIQYSKYINYPHIIYTFNVITSHVFLLLYVQNDYKHHFLNNWEILKKKTREGSLHHNFKIHLFCKDTLALIVWCGLRINRPKWRRCLQCVYGRIKRLVYKSFYELLIIKMSISIEKWTQSINKDLQKTETQERSTIYWL